MAHYRHSEEGEVNENIADKAEYRKAGKKKGINVEKTLTDFKGANEPLPSKLRERVYPWLSRNFAEKR
jgi:hypothetical protein